MTDILSPSKRSQLMSRIRNSDTSPELALRKALWHKGLRYRTNYKIGRCTPDIAFVRLKLAIFVDGCFWHQCPIHGKKPAQNKEFWDEKLRKNIQRDTAVTKMLSDAGWVVIRLWEHEVEGSLDFCIKSVLDMIAELKARRE